MKQKWFFIERMVQIQSIQLEKTHMIQLLLILMVFIMVAQCMSSLLFFRVIILEQTETYYITFILIIDMTGTKYLDSIGTECFKIETEFDILEIRYGCIEIGCDSIDIINDNVQIMCIEKEFELFNGIGIIYEMKKHLVIQKQDKLLLQKAGEDKYLCAPFLYHHDGEVNICFDIIIILCFLLLLIVTTYMIEQSSISRSLQVQA